MRTLKKVTILRASGVKYIIIKQFFLDRGETSCDMRERRISNAFHEG